jgi:hypothetical protein
MLQRTQSIEHRTAKAVLQQAECYQTSLDLGALENNQAPCHSLFCIICAKTIGALLCNPFGHEIAVMILKTSVLIKCLTSHI